MPDAVGRFDARVHFQSAALLHVVQVKALLLMENPEGDTVLSLPAKMGDTEMWGVVVDTLDKYSLLQEVRQPETKDNKTFVRVCSTFLFSLTILSCSHFRCFTPERTNLFHLINTEIARDTGIETDYRPQYSLPRDESSTQRLVCVRVKALYTGTDPSLIDEHKVVTTCQ